MTRVYLTPHDRAQRAIAQRLEFVKQQLGPEWAIVLAAQVLTQIDSTLLPALEAQVNDARRWRVVRRRTRR